MARRAQLGRGDKGGKGCRGPDSLRFHAARPREIPARLAELDREWDVDRAITAGAGALTLAGLALTALADRRFVAVPAMVGGFLLQHAIQGWARR